MIIFSIKQLETLYWVAKLSSFRKTADKLHATPAAISNRITSLEKLTGKSLLDREIGEVKLSPAGQSIFPKIQRFIQLAEELQEAFGGLDYKKQVVRLFVSEPIVHSWLSHFLDEFRDKYPNIDILLTVDYGMSNQNKITIDTIDIAFLISPASIVTEYCVPLPSVPLVWVSSPKLNIRTQGKVSLEYLANYPIIVHETNTNQFSEIREKFGQLTKIPRIYPSNSLTASLNLVISGIGVACLPRCVVNGEIASKQLQILNCEWLPSEMQFVALLCKEQYTFPKQEIIELAVRSSMKHKEIIAV